MTEQAKQKEDDLLNLTGPDEEDSTEPETEPKITYQREVVQSIPLTIVRGERIFEVSILMGPMQDEQFFKLMEKVPENAKRVKGVSLELFAPYADLGRQLATGREGYVQREDWRQKTPSYDFIGAMQSYLHVTTAKADDTVDSDLELLDDDAEVPVSLTPAFNGQECRTRIFFREETKDQMDEYLAAIGGEPQKNVIASHKKISKERRLFALYNQLKTRDENYSDAGVPAWHAIEAVSGFLNSQVARMGKLSSV